MIKKFEQFVNEGWTSPSKRYHITGRGKNKKSIMYTPEFDKDGFDQYGIDRDGFDKDGFDKDGYDRDGYHKKTKRNRSGFNRQGYDEYGFDKNGLNRKGKTQDQVEIDSILSEIRSEETKFKKDAQSIDCGDGKVYYIKVDNNNNLLLSLWQENGGNGLDKFFVAPPIYSDIIPLKYSDEFEKWIVTKNIKYLKDYKEEIREVLSNLDIYVDDSILSN